MRGRVIKMYEEDQDLIEDVLVEIRQAIDMSSIYLNILSGTMDAFSSIISKQPKYRDESIGFFNIVKFHTYCCIRHLRHERRSFAGSIFLVSDYAVYCMYGCCIYYPQKERYAFNSKSCKALFYTII